MFWNKKHRKPEAQDVDLEEMDIHMEAQDVDLEEQDIYMEEYLDESDQPLKKAKSGKGKMIFLGVAVSFICLTLCVSIAGAAYVGWQITKAPNVEAVDCTPDEYLSVILDVNGEKTHSLYNAESNRIHVSLNNIPEDLQNAFIAVEDSRFYEHKGIDVKGIVRAALKGITKGHFSEGASTLTQQLLKNNVFKGWTEEQTFENRLSRKIQEQYLALQLEKKYEKSWILENYLNTINLGGGTRGVQTAAQFYFGKNASELTLAESALIAGITKNPSGYNPKKFPEASLERQQIVLKLMEEQGYITAEERAAALEEDVIGHLDYEHSQSANALSWFEDALLVSLVQDLMTYKGMSEDDAWNLIYAGGLTIYSTQNSALQFICECAVNNPDFIRDSEQISVVMTDVETGAVAAIVGGRGEKDASLIYNRATDSVCQPGSTIKIIGEYAAALDQGLTTLGTTVEDEPYTYSDGTVLHNANGVYGGKTTIRDAISSSCNVIALKTMKDTSIETTAEYIRKFGITTLTEDDYQEALAIGGTYNGITNLELTGAYNAIASDGCYIRPYFYTKVIDYKGDTILERDTEKSEIIKSGTAALLTLGMEEVIENGTGSSVYCDGIELAGKSGTTNDFRDVWFVGFSSDYTLGVWGGYDDHSAQENSGYVKDIWRTIMQQTPSVKAVDLNNPLVDTSKLTAKVICKKCGKLAVANLCDQTVQGNMTTTEYYVPGTEPRSYCDCHIRVTLCEKSGMRCSFYCPKDCRYDSVFLVSAVPGTEDEGYAAEWLSNATCTEHTHIWDKWRREEEKKKNENNNSNNNGNGNGNGNGNNNGAGNGNGNSNDNGSGNGNGNGNNNGNNNDNWNNDNADALDENQGGWSITNSFSPYLPGILGNP